VSDGKYQVNAKVGGGRCSPEKSEWMLAEFLKHTTNVEYPEGEGDNTMLGAAI
jgi:hypothetical protein